MSKRTLDAFFKPKPTGTSTKRAKPSNDDTPHHHQDEDEDIGPPDTHPSYPIPIPQLPSHISISLTHGTPAKEPRAITDQPDLDLLYFQPYITRPTANELFKFLRRELPFYRVQYTIKRGGIETDINTPRYTTVFGVDDTAQWTSDPTTQEPDSDEESSSANTTTTTNSPTKNQQRTSPTSFSKLTLIETTSKLPIRTTKYQYTPRPLPTCLHHLKTLVESATGSRYNFCLVNYYSTGNDSISFHSDDERFLGANPDIASLSLGGEREFLMKHKPVPTSTEPSAGDAGSRSASANLKFPLSSGDMLIMRGPTQSNWLHSIPKRKGRGGDAVRGRINITFRRARVPGGTNNYYRYNVGDGPVWRWDEKRQEMVCTGASGDGDGGLEKGGDE
ncbi:DNA oxidative demethylase ALKBH2 [Penicillium rolfsii]|nr:DNA oxidative demethylase ALKBH2 [Penicillium rolfsii]